MTINKDLAVKTILNLENSDFDTLISKLSKIDLSITDKKLIFYINPEFENNINVYYGDDVSSTTIGDDFVSFGIQDLFNYCECIKEHLDSDSSKRIDRLVNTRGLYSYFSYALIRYKALHNLSDEECSSILNDINNILYSDESKHIFLDSLQNRCVCYFRTHRYWA